MIPDRVIVKKIKAYDKNLFIKWNGERGFFELWMKRPYREPIRLEPITQRLYDSSKELEYVPLDERLLWWVYTSDAHRVGPKQHALSIDKRFLEFQKSLDKSQYENFKDRAKDIWQSANSFYMTKDKAKNGKPKFENYEKKKWIAPDSQMRTSPRLFTRSRMNALQYNYKRR